MSDTRCQGCGWWECICEKLDAAAPIDAKPVYRQMGTAIGYAATLPTQPPFAVPVYDTRRPAALAKLGHALDLALLDHSNAPDMQRLRDALTCWEAWEILDREEI